MKHHQNYSNPSTPKSVTTAYEFGTWGPIADSITVTSLTLAITVTPHSPTIVTTYTSHKNTKSPSLASLASGTNKLVSSHLPTVPSSSTLMELNSAAPPSPSPCKSYCRFLFGSDSTAYAVDSCKRGCFSKLKTNDLMVTEYLLELFSCLFISRVFVRVILHSQLPTKEWASYPLDY